MAPQALLLFKKKKNIYVFDYNAKHLLFNLYSYFIIIVFSLYSENKIVINKDIKCFVWHTFGKILGPPLYLAKMVRG
jgi:hypothetical protein